MKQTPTEMVNAAKTRGNIILQVLSLDGARQSSLNGRTCISTTVRIILIIVSIRLIMPRGDGEMGTNNKEGGSIDK